MATLFLFTFIQTLYGPARPLRGDCSRAHHLFLFLFPPCIFPHCLRLLLCRGRALRRYQPYTSRRLNRIEQLSLVTAILTLWVPSYVRTAGAEHTAAGLVSTGALLLLNISVVSLFLYRFSHALFHSVACFSKLRGVFVRKGETSAKIAPVVEESIAGESKAEESNVGESIVGESIAGESIAGESIAGESVAGTDTPSGALSESSVHSAEISSAEAASLNPQASRKKRKRKRKQKKGQQKKTKGGRTIAKVDVNSEDSNDSIIRDV